MISRPALAAAAVLMAPAALANCPVAADLAGGIYVTYDDDSYTAYRGTLGGEVIERTTITDGSGDIYEVPTLSGLYSTGYVDGPGGRLDPATTETVTYSEDLRAWLPVAAGQQFSVRLTRSYADGTEPTEERYSVVVGQETEVDLAGCRYRALPVTHTFVDPNGVYGLVQQYLPELGIGIYVSYAEMGSAPDAYKVLEISTRPPG